eukprot:CAMPEP_0170605654 /NCGR_PEP_ID=MMETSP0224-20130122/20086_1 /TAXON_ID=285029 /ORGANISM="Togula jolla, Strain CCCM 725" /LENGTH=187 /DNA_ID=CAMNT_0010930667 /DNA_START=44 /DNA_END=604 /DNA_ORIENTATION=-
MPSCGCSRSAEQVRGAGGEFHSETLVPALQELDLTAKSRRLADVRCQVQHICLVIVRLRHSIEGLLSEDDVARAARTLPAAGALDVDVVLVATASKVMPDFAGTSFTLLPSASSKLMLKVQKLLLEQVQACWPPRNGTARLQRVHCREPILGTWYRAGPASPAARAYLCKDAADPRRCAMATCRKAG